VIRGIRGLRGEFPIHHKQGIFHALLGIEGDREGTERCRIEDWRFREEGEKRRWSTSDVCMECPGERRSDRNPHPEDTGRARNDRSGEREANNRGKPRQEIEPKPTMQS
jgi:hypothetical protein